MTKDKQKNNRSLKGQVTSDKMDKTIVVKVTSLKMNKKYHKRYKVSTSFKVHDKDNQAKVGDNVIIEECRPLSKDKKWRLVEIKK